MTDRRNYSNTRKSGAWIGRDGSSSPARPPLSTELKNFKLIRQREEDGSVDHIIGVFLLGPNGHELREYNGEILKPASIEADINQALAKG